VVQPRRRGIHCEHYTGATLNRHERALDDGSLDGAIVAGCARAARLSAPSVLPRQHKAVFDVFASSVAPALTAFVDHVLDECVRRGIGTVCFLARDGQLLHRIAVARARARTLKLDLRYVYGSRQALHLPGYTDIGLAATWLLEDTPQLTLGDLAARSGQSNADVLRLAARYGLIGDADRNIPSTERSRLAELIRDPTFERDLARASEARWAAAYAYYLQEGFGREHPVALVDVGWNGRMQASLRRIVDKAMQPSAPIHGFYFCLARKLRASASDTLEGYAFDPDRDRGANRLDGYRAMVEAFLEADHGTTLGFEANAGSAIPMIAAPPPAPALMAARAQQDAVLAFVASLGQAEAAIGRRVTIEKLRSLEVLTALLRYPTPAEAAAFHERERAEGQIETRTDALVRKLGSGRELLQRERLGFWPEGSASLSGLRWLLPLLSVARRLRQSGH
jgi:hypothetical protein